MVGIFVIEGAKVHRLINVGFTIQKDFTTKYIQPLVEKFVNEN
jgi:hypothetical protein